MLVKRYERQVAVTVIGMLGPGDSAEDIGQETFIRFYKALDKFRGESSVGTYLTRIAINLCLNQIKKRKRRSWFFSVAESEPEDRADISPQVRNDGWQSLEKEEKKEFVRQAILKLNPEYRSVIVMRLMEGYSSQETADLLGIPLGTALSRLARAQQKLREILNMSMGVAYAG
ncbi:MAG: RNA polymerase sigma factor [Planctomycetota bacterium]